MFKIESYVTPILLSYVDKYVRDFKPADAQVSLWGGGVALHNLVLKADVLQQEVSLPFTLVSGRIHELLIQVPWTKIISEPIVITIDTIECVLNLNPPIPQDDTSPPEPPRRTQVVEAPPGYMQALVRRIVSNIALRVHHLIVKYVQDDIVLSLNVKHLAVDSADPLWEPSFADIDPVEPVIRRLVRLDDLTLCLDRADSDGKIRFYQEPLLYRCQLDLRVLTRLVSANTRRATGLSVQVRSSKLAWGVTNDQLVLLLRLLNESPRVEAKPPPPAPKMAAQAMPMHPSLNSAEPARTESWSEWAWSWLPAWADREGAEETPAPPAPIPVALVAYLDDVALVLKMMEVEGGTRKRARPVLELSASHAAVKIIARSPTMMRVRLGLRSIALSARGKCPCGHNAINTSKQEPTVYLSKTEADSEENPWMWPEADPTDARIELAQVADETLRDTNTPTSFDHPTTSDQPEVVGQTEQPTECAGEDLDPLWQHMAPVLFVEYIHERSPPELYTNPYENPPADFEYSDWVEACSVRVQIRPLRGAVCPALVHRVGALYTALGELPPTPVADLPTRTLTVEECDALMENLPQKRISIEMRELSVRLLPWDHAAMDKSTEPLLSLDIEVPKAAFVITGPLYPHRVCSAACQMPDDSGPLWNGARLHMSGTVSSAQAQLWAGAGNPRPCARADARFALHLLLNRHMFSQRESVVLSYTLKLRELSICGSSARIQAATQVVNSLVNERLSPLLQHSTLAKDALNDEESVAIDLTAEELSLRGYLTANIHTHILSLQSARATAYHAPKDEEMKQAWLFSAPDVSTTTPYLRFAVQWCKFPTPNLLEYLGVWTEPISFCADPLLIAWLAYKPTILPYRESHHTQLNTSASQYGLRRRTTPPSSSGRAGSRTGSGAELVHVRPRSVGSSSEPSERRDQKQQAAVKSESKYWDGERVVQIHTRLRRALVNVELGLVIVYASGGTASALDCATVHDAMERHARHAEPVLALSLGRVSMHSNTTKKHLWQEIRHDGPTLINVTNNTSENSEDDSFPWKLRLADVSCYTLGIQVPAERSSRDFSARTQRSQLKVPEAAHKTVLEMVTTTITLSVVTKALQIKPSMRRDRTETAKPEPEDKTKYFTSGIDFKPSTLKEFFRGPAKRKKSTVTPNAETQTQETQAPEQVPSSGPLVSLGVHLHADTPPTIVRLDREQVHLVATAVHGLQHMLALLQRRPVIPPRTSYTSVGTSRRSLIRSVSEIEEVRTPSEDTQSENPSENRSELISIFESYNVVEPVVKLKTFFWFQWVVSRATLVVATRSVKLAFDIDDIISTVDLQSHYSQLKVKIASASVRHYERSGSYDWTAGVLGGRVLEAREPNNALEENHFMSITVTQARIANLPANWKEELHPKLLEEKSNTDTMWEIYATVAPLEAVLQPEVLKNIMSLAYEFAPRSFCPLQEETSERKISNWQWPMCYVNAGGLRLLLISEEENRLGDDTFIFQINKLTVSPYPENPICRRPVNSTADVSWLGSTGLLEGQQYEVLVHGVGVRAAQLQQLACQEVSQNELLKGTGGENPAFKWTQPVIAPVITPMLHNVDIGCVLAPAIYSSDLLISGPAVEFNLVSDCCVDVSLEQLRLAAAMLTELAGAKPKELSFEDDKCDACPFAPLLISAEQVQTDTSSQYVFTEAGEGTDSGVDTITSHSTLKTGSRLDDTTSKKTLSVVFVDHNAVPSEYLEVFVTMGVIDISLYTMDDGSPAVVALRPPAAPATATAPANAHATNAAPSSAPAPAQSPQVKVIFEEAEHKEDDVCSVSSRTKSLSDTMRTGNASKMKLQFGEHTDLQQYMKVEGSIPLLHVTLHQPNLYYWRRKAQKSLQVSLFNAWVGLGAGQTDGQWNIPLLSTSRGIADPITDIPPALATLRLSAPTPGNTRGSIQLDVERPVQVQVCMERVHRLTSIIALIQEELPQAEHHSATPTKEHVHLPLLYRLRRFLVQHSGECVTVHTSQVSVCGSEGTVGCEGVSLQVGVAARPDRLHARALVQALLVAAGPPLDRRHPLVQPVAIGVNMEATWDAWRRSEGGSSSLQPTVNLCVDVDQLCLELRPSELGALARLQKALDTVLQETSSLRFSTSYAERDVSSKQSSSSTKTSQRQSSNTNTELSDHYYKDDLRSGAFKLVGGGQLPMAYQVTLHEQTVAWRYPHPRAVTRVLAFPLPDQDEEIQCILEFYNPVVGEWHAYANFNIPVSGPVEVKLYIIAADAVFAQMWRMRPRPEKEHKQMPFEFDFARYLPRNDPVAFEHPPEPGVPLSSIAITAEQLCGAVRVDSYFAPRALPRLRLSARAAGLQLHAHNALPLLPSQAKSLEGYYVSRPLMRSHRVLSLIFRDAGVHAFIGAPAGGKATLQSSLSADIMDCATGTMEPLVDEFRLQLAMSFPEKDLQKSRWRGCATDIRAALHVPCLRTAGALVADWHASVRQYMGLEEDTKGEDLCEHTSCKRVVAAAASSALEGRVSMWIHNSCACSLRVGQDATDERVTLGPGTRFAYRWRSPTAPKGLRIAFAGPVTDWIWSNSVPFVPGTYRVRLESGEAVKGGGGAIHAHVAVEGDGAKRTMRLAGRLQLANLLRYNLLYKVRTRSPDSPQWQTVVSGELESESFGVSIMCATDAEMALKIKFTTHDTGWSGDIPLKECPKENVPWLVKVPSEGELAYISVWCRVVRARSDGRVLCAVWPLYVLHSHVPHDTDVMIETESCLSPGSETLNAEKPAPLIQSAQGRGASTHLVAPGTTSARHNLSFQYRDIDCPVTRDAVPLHYGVTDTSVFDKRTPVNNLEDVISDILAWLDRSGRNAKSSWPYSLVTKHWPGTWQPALLQPRCDVNVRYEAVRAGGGCSLELRLCPAALVCNAAPIALTLRAHDATPLCKLEPGTALSPPSVLLQKPFFISVELNRDTFVSGQLTLSSVEPGRYGTPPPGHLAPHHPAPFAIHCNNRVALLTMYYEIIHEINVLGASSTYEFINRLDTDVLVSAVAVPKDLDDDLPLRPKLFKVVEPCKETSIHGVPLCRFWLGGRWRSGGEPSELAPFLCVALPSTAGPDPPSTVPVRLGQPPLRRAIALRDDQGQSTAVVVTQLKHEGRWLVTLAPDPCPQFLVYNHTRDPLAVAQPKLADDDPSNSKIEAVSECEGVHWWCIVEPQSATHYSSLAHCERYPPPPTAPSPPSIQFLTLARAASQTSDLYWCPPIAVTEGEQLVQLYGGRTVKLRVTSYPHSTLLQLRDVRETDISASDIRNRLLKPQMTKEKVGESSQLNASFHVLEREKADSHLLLKSTLIDSAPRSGVISTESDANIPIVIESDSTEHHDTCPREPMSPDLHKSVTIVSSDCQLTSQEKPEAFHRQTVTVDNDESLNIIKDTSSLLRPSVAISEEACTSDREHTAYMSKDFLGSETSNVFQDIPPGCNGAWSTCERARFVVSSLAIEVAGGADEPPLLALHLDRAVLLLHVDDKGTNTTLSIAGVQVDNLQYSNGQYDFAVVASTSTERPVADRWPFLWGMLVERDSFTTKEDDARLLLKLRTDHWTVLSRSFSEITEVELSVGPLALYVEDAYVSALVELARIALPPAPQGEAGALLGEMRALQAPLRLRALLVHPLRLTLTLHTAVRMYIALDQSPLQLGAFHLKDVVTSVERLTHALTVHYLSAAILGAGWVVGGLELLGAPGALAARVGGAGGGVRGVAVAAAAAVVRSLAACAGSLARNLDLLAGDEEHARRAAAARRRHPQSLAAGILAGVTNFAINILGAVGGLAHHPLVGVAVGEGSSAAALRRSLVGAVAKPLSATADLVAYAGHGLLTQAGWEALPQARRSWWSERSCGCAAWCAAGWRRDCVRWTFRLAELSALSGHEAAHNAAALALLTTHKFLVVADLETERIVEMIDFRSCTLAPYSGPAIELYVTQRRMSKIAVSRVIDEDDEYQVSAAAMARVARYTGADTASVGAGAGAGAAAVAGVGANTETRTIALQAEPGRALALHAALAAAIRNNCDTHFALL